MRTIPSGPRPEAPGRLLSSIPSTIRVLPVLACGLMLAAPGRAGVVPVVSPFYAGAEQTDDRMIYVGGSGSGGKLAIDCHADFSLARDDNNVVQNWCNLGTFKWTFGFFSFDGPISEYPLAQDVGGSKALTFDGGDKMRMILEPGYGYTLPSEITDGVLTVEMWIQNPSVQAGEVLVRFEDTPNLDLTVDNFSMSGSTSWQHLVAVSNGTQTSYYLNGSHVTTQAGALSFSDTAVINLGAQSFTGSIAAIRVHTEEMSAADISHNNAGGVGLGTYLFYPIHEDELDHSWWGDPTQSPELSWFESAHGRSMWKESENPNPYDPGTGEGYDIADRVQNIQLNDLETVFTYMNEKSGKHLPLVSNDEDKRGDGRKYKWIVGNAWGGAFAGYSPMGLGYGIAYTGNINPHEYVHGTDIHQMNSITGHWWESHANFQVSWLGTPQGNPVWSCPESAHVYPSTGSNYYQAHLIFDHLVESPEYGGLYVTRMWNLGPSCGPINVDGNPEVFPPQAMKDMASPDKNFDHEWVKMAARNITWDYPSHPEYATSWPERVANHYGFRKHFTLLEEVPYRTAGWYEPPKWRTPQQHGYNICVLEPNQGMVTADLTGHIDSARGSAWSAMFVAVANGTPRYGTVFTNGTQGSFTVNAGDDELYLVVVATPTNILKMGIFSGDGVTDYRGAPKDRFPYQVLLGGTTPKATAWQPSAAINGTVDPTAYVSPTAYIHAGAQVLGNARVEDYAQVYGTVSGNAVVSGHAHIKSNATVTDNALVSDYAVIRSGSTIYGNARVLEHADIHGDDIYDHAVCKGNSVVKGSIHGNAIIDGNYYKTEAHSTGYQFLWAWGDYLQDGETYEDFGGLFLEYKFEQQNDYRVWDTYGVTWGRLINGASYAADHGGTVLDLDGVDQFVDLHSSVATANDVSFVVDVKWDGGANGQRIFEFSNPNGDVCWLSPSDSQGKLSFGIKIDGVEQVVRAADPLPTGVWKTVTVMMYEDTAIVQINGLDSGSNDAFTHNIKDVSASACYLGRGASGGYFDGRMDNFTVWSRSLIDVTSPTPDPAGFFVKPASMTETKVAMVSLAGADAGGNVEYLFEESSNNNGADDSGWQLDRTYYDEDLDSTAPYYVYRVTMRDAAGNKTDSSAVTYLTWQDTPVVTQNNDATGLAVVEAEDYSRKSAGESGKEWELDYRAGYVGSGAMRVPEVVGIKYGDNYLQRAPRMDYMIDFTKTGDHWVWVRTLGDHPDADSYHLGLDMTAPAWGQAQQWNLRDEYIWLKKGPFTIAEAGVHTINLWMREDGTIIDRLLVTSDDSYVPTSEVHGATGDVIGDGPAVTGTHLKEMLLESAITDTTAPTSGPEPFQALPAAVSGYTISMTATAGTDASGDVEYYFEETSGNPGGTDSGWQSSATYSDFQLTPDTSYSYRVRMRDIFGNISDWSAIESVSTTNEVDDQAPTPNRATFAVAPTADSSSSISMTATTGTDVMGPVEYYFAETSGNLGGNDSRWQTSPTYTDTNLTPSLQYTYTVQMRDSLGNTGTASLPASATTDDLVPRGDHRIVFQSSVAASRNHTTMASFDAWATELAQTPGAVDEGGALGTTWNVIGATQADPDILSRTGTHPDDDPENSIGIYLTDGSLFAPSYAKFWSSDIPVVDNPKNDDPGHDYTLYLDERGEIAPPNDPVHTGLITDDDGLPILGYSDDPSPVSQGLDVGAEGNIWHGGGGVGYNTLSPWFAGYGTWFTANNTRVFVISGLILGDTDAPTPNRATFASAPVSTSDTEITMTATTGTDETGPVQYYFDETSGNPGGTDSGWQTSPTYTDTGLSANTQYTYSVTMRDTILNEGTASSDASATTDAPPVADTDGDGLADLREDEHFGNNDGSPTPAELAVSDGSGDFDGDGTSDLAELRLGLNPSDPNSRFTLEASPGLADTVALSWPSQDGLHFKIYFTDDLSLPLANWNETPVSDNDDDGAPTHEWTDEDATSSPRRFYRVGLLP